MPDITIGDAIAFGTVLVTVFAGLFGLKKGDDAAKATPAQPSVAMIGAAIVDRETLADLTEAVRGLSDTLRAGVASNERIARDDVGARIKELAERIDAKRG